jgi:hypothetical protein
LLRDNNNLEQNNTRGQDLAPSRQPTWGTIRQRINARCGAPDQRKKKEIVPDDPAPDLILFWLGRGALGSSGLFPSLFDAT